jgi:hypothetical protein
MAALIVLILGEVSVRSRIYFFGGYETAVAIGAIISAAVTFRLAAADVVAVNADIALWLRSKLTLRTRQLIIGLALIPYCIVALSMLAGKQWFGDYQKPATVVGLALMFALTAFLGPTAAELVEMRRKKFRDYLRWRRQHRDKL